MTNEKLVELIDDQLQTQLVEIVPTKKESSRRYVEQRVIEEMIINRRIVSSTYFIA
jgi:hypothetical protein